MYDTPSPLQLPRHQPSLPLFHSSVSLPLPASDHQSICHETLSIYLGTLKQIPPLHIITPNPDKDLPLSNKADVEPSVPLCHT